MRRAVSVLTLAVVAVAWPLVRDLDHDSFPLSNYPMFTSEQPATTSFVRAIGLDAAGRESVLPPAIAGGTVEVIHANRTLNRALREGRADEMCAEIAARAAGRPDLVTVLIVTERYGVIDGLRAADPTPLARSERARCAIVR